MAVLKYKNAQGEYVALVNYSVSPLTPVQETGTSTTDVMSQNAVTVELNKKANSADVYSKNDVNTTFLTKTDASTTYATPASVSTQISNATANYVTETQVNTIVYGTETKPVGNVEVVTTNNLATTLASYPTTTVVEQKIADLVDGAPETLDTLKELADALKTEQDAVDAIEAGIATKANAADVYTKKEVDDKIAASGTFDASLYYNKTTTDSLLNAKADKTAIPTKVSDLTNDEGFTSNVGTITGITMNGASKGTSGVVNLGTVITSHQDISGKADKATTLAGYGITDAKIASGVITLGSNTITPLTSIPAEYVTDTELTAKNYVTLANVKADTAIAATISEKDWNTGHTSTTNATIPVTKRLCIATWTSSYTLSVGAIADGRELHIIGKNNGSSDITITFPSSGIVKMSGDSITIAAGAYADINIISDGTNKYLRAL